MGLIVLIESATALAATTVDLIRDSIFISIGFTFAFISFIVAGECKALEKKKIVFILSVVSLLLVLILPLLLMSISRVALTFMIAAIFFIPMFLFGGTVAFLVFGIIKPIEKKKYFIAAVIFFILFVIAMVAGFFV